MGSPISSTMAEAFFQHIENVQIKQLLESKNITFYTRYVDDILIIYDTKRTTASKIKTYLDHIHKDLKLTPTYEQGQINFLDILITKQQKTTSISTSTENP
jgi:HJR/Mrr/RecB family endonuclease